MKHILQVLKFEYLTCVKNKSFIISTAIFIIMIMLLSFLPAIITGITSSKDEPKTDPDGNVVLPVVAVVNDAYKDNDDLVRSHLEKYFEGNEIRITNEAQDSIETKVDNEDYTFAIILKSPLSFTYITKNNGLMNSNIETGAEAVTQLFRITTLSALGVTPEQTDKVMYAKAQYDTVTTGKDQTKNYWSTYILIMMLYMAVIMYGQMVSQSVVSEKNTRAMEMLITCAKPSHLMFGKVIGSGLAGLTQLVLIIGAALGSVNIISKDSIPEEILNFINFPVSTVLYALLFFILGYFIYSFLLGALSSLASRSEDLNTLISPVMMLYVAAFMIVIICVNSDSINGVLMVVCSYIPFTAPIAMFARVSLADVAVYEVIISIVIQIVSVYLLGMLAAAIYKIGVLMYGNPPKPFEVIKMLTRE